MSRKRPTKASESKALSALNSTKSLPNPEEQVPEFIFNRQTGEIIITDPSGKKAVMKASVVEAEDEDEVIEPLSIADFQKALRRINKLKLEWTADSPPLVRPKNPKAEANLGSDEFIAIQNEYPNLPREVGVAVAYALTGGSYYAGLLGGEELLREKAQIVSKSVITVDFRAEYFFKNAMKVPYLSDIDWEVVFKFEEKNVEGQLMVAYALLSLSCRGRSVGNHPSLPDHLTLAVNEEMVDRYIETFQEIKGSLKRSMQISNSVHKHLAGIEEDTDE